MRFGLWNQYNAWFHKKRSNMDNMVPKTHLYVVLGTIYLCPENRDKSEQKGEVGNLRNLIITRNQKHRQLFLRKE